MEFKLIVAGGRDFNDAAALETKLYDLADGALAFKNVSIVSGMARGADALGFAFAKTNNIQCYEFSADWDKYGKSAGFRRNADMAYFADGLLAFWDGKSKGTKHMIECMYALNKPVWIYNY